MKELKLSELSLEQKLGMSMVALCWENTEEDLAFLEQQIKNHALGGIWVHPRMENYQATLKRLLAAADYPILSFTDAEGGWGDFKIGSHNPIGVCNSEELAYIFGKVTAVLARQEGYNVICNPVLDINGLRALCGGNSRTLGGNKETVTRLAKAEARGMHDAGVLTVGKHYPGFARTAAYIDAHMAETASDETLEELLDVNLFPYLELMKDGLLDGVMLEHSRFTNVDPDYPASLSTKHFKLLKDRGFDGFAISDALIMMGVVAKYGRRNSVGLAIGNAGSIALPWNYDNAQTMQWLRECYQEGIISDEKLDEVVASVLAAQHKVNVAQPKFTELTEEDLRLFARLSTDSVFAKCDENVPTALDRNGKHFFAILTETEMDIRDADKVSVDTMKATFYHPLEIAERLKELFPNSQIGFISEYPTQNRIAEFLSECLDCDGVVFITSYIYGCYKGKESFTARILSMMDAMQVSNRISTIVHFGNPYLLEDIPHIPRILSGICSVAGVEAALEVLAGEREAKGTLTFDNIQFK